MQPQFKATDEEKKDAQEALVKYDTLVDDVSRKRFLYVCMGTFKHISLTCIDMYKEASSSFT